MTIGEMHVMFRELTQQMGMQTVRAILMEDIDICLNAAIIAKVRSIISENVGMLPYNDKVARQNAAISPVNALRTLYDKQSITTITGTGTEVDPFKVSINSSNIMLYTGFKVSYNNNNIYDCRIIEAEDLGQTLRDFCNRAAKDAPIVTVFGDTEKIDVDIYTGRKSPTKPKVLQYLYIKKPATVSFDEDTLIGVDCDLPSYLHSEIVEDGARLWLAGVGATIASNNKNNQ